MPFSHHLVGLGQVGSLRQKRSVADTFWILAIVRQAIEIYFGRQWIAAKFTNEMGGSRALGAQSRS